MHASLAAPLSLVFSPLVFWPYFGGAALTLIGVFAVRRELTEASGVDKILALGRVFVAASLAAFSAEHFGLAKFIQQGVPSWIPWHLFWAYFVGCALLAAALSIATKVQARLSATLLGVMIFFFVLSIHLPKVLANPHDRIAWAVLVRDSSFAGGAWALAGSDGRVENSRYPQADHARASSDRSGCGVLRGRTSAAFPIRARRSSWQAHAHVVSRSSSYRVRHGRGPDGGGRKPAGR